MFNDGDLEILDGKETGLIWSSKYGEWIHPDLDLNPEKYHSLETLYPERFRNENSPPPVDGEKEYSEGIETGLIWSEIYNDWIHPDLDSNPEKYHDKKKLIRILNERRNT